MNAWLEGLSTFEVVLLVLGIVFGGSVASAVVGGLLVAIGLPGLASLLFFVPPFHMYRHLKGAYELGRFSALLRTMALLTFAFVAAGMFLAASVAIGTM